MKDFPRIANLQGGHKDAWRSVNIAVFAPMPSARVRRNGGKAGRLAQHSGGKPKVLPTRLY